MTVLRSFAFALVVLLCVPPMQTQSVQAESSITTVDLTFTTIDVPGAGFTNVASINAAGDVVGYYGTDSNAKKRGFLYRNGNLALVDYPGADATFLYGINDSGLIVGSAEFRGGAHCHRIPV